MNAAKQPSPAANAEAASRMARVFKLVAGLSKNESIVFHEAFIVGKPKAQVCDEHQWAGHEYDTHFSRVMRSLRGIKTPQAALAA